MQNASFFVEKLVGHLGQLLRRDVFNLVGELTPDFDGKAGKNMFFHDVVDRYFSCFFKNVRIM